MWIKLVIFGCAAVGTAIAANESTTAAVPAATVTAATEVPSCTNVKDQMAAPSIQDHEYANWGSISSGLLSTNSWKPIAEPPSQHISDSGGESDVKTITLTKPVPVPYPVMVEKRVPVRIEVPIDKPFPVYVPRPYHVFVEKKVPYHVNVPVPQPYTVEKHVPLPVKVPVDKPVPVAVPHPYPVLMYRKVPYTVERHVPYPVKVPYFRPYPVRVPVEKHVPFPVERVVPYPVHVAVDRPVPVPVEKPVPYPVEKIVPVPVSKIVPVPYKVPVKVFVKVPYPQPKINHNSIHEASSTPLLHSATAPQQNTYQLEQTKYTPQVTNDNPQEAYDLPQETNDLPQETNDHPQVNGVEYSQVYADKNQWAQIAAAHHQTDESHAHLDRVKFPNEPEDDVAATDQESTHHQVGTYDDEGESSQIKDEDSQQNIPETYSPPKKYRPVRLRHQQQYQDDGGSQASEDDIAEFEKRLKDGRHESYSKVTIQRGRYN